MASIAPLTLTGQDAATSAIEQILFVSHRIRGNGEEAMGNKFMVCIRRSFVAPGCVFLFVAGVSAAHAQASQTSGSQSAAQTVSGSSSGSGNINATAMLQRASGEKLELSKDEIEKIAQNQKSPSDKLSSAEKWVSKEEKYCNTNDYVQMSSGYALNDAARFCGMIAAGGLSVLGPQNPDVELAFQKACALPRSSQLSSQWIDENYCAELGNLYQKRGQLDLALAVYQNAPNCHANGYTPENPSEYEAECPQGVASVLKAEAWKAKSTPAAQQPPPTASEQPQIAAALSDLNSGGAANDLQFSYDQSSGVLTYGASTVHLADLDIARASVVTPNGGFQFTIPCKGNASCVVCKITPGNTTPCTVYGTFPYVMFSFPPATVNQVNDALQKLFTATGLDCTNTIFAQTDWITRAIARGKADYSMASLDDVQSAAQLGNAAAEAELGNRYYGGRGVTKDYTQAAAWWSKSANQGNADGENLTGWAYQLGIGVPENLSLAIAWYQKAAAQGNGDAAQNLTSLRQQAAAAQSAEQASNDGGSSESASDWQQDHQNKIEALTQEIAMHEKQAQQDDADAQQAEAQASQNSGISGGFGAIANAVNSGLNTGLAQHDRDAAQQERQQAQDERQQLAALGAEQPPVAVDNSEQINLTRMQTGMINNGQTISGALQQQQSNIQAVRQAQANAQKIAQEEANGAITPQQAMTQLQQQAQQGAQQTQPPATTPSTVNPAPASSTCPSFPAFVMASSNSIVPATDMGQPGYQVTLQYTIPPGYRLDNACAQVSNFGTSCNLQNGMITIEGTPGDQKIWTSVRLDNGTYQVGYAATINDNLPSPVTMTVFQDHSAANPGGCGLLPAASGSGTVN
jgi:Sel1 repeat